MYTKPLFEDRSTNIYKVRDHDEWKYINEEELQKYGNMEFLSDKQREKIEKDAEKRDNSYKSSMKRSGPLEVVLLYLWSCLVYFRKKLEETSRGK